MKHRFTREDWFDLVWAVPFLTISRKYKISYLTFRKLGRQWNLPLPPNGHWTNVRLNKLVQLPALPEKSDGPEYVEWALREREAEQPQVENCMQNLFVVH